VLTQDSEKPVYKNRFGRTIRRSPLHDEILDIPSEDEIEEVPKLSRPSRKRATASKSLLDLKDEPKHAMQAEIDDLLR